jgi:glycogen debranching enzyme
MTNIFEIDGKNFALASEMPMEIRACQIGDRSIPTLTLKDNELFLITDTLGNITDMGCNAEGLESSMGLFCRDTRFLSRLELQIDGRSAVPFGSNAQKGFSMSVLCSNRQIGEDQDEIRAETISIHREILIKGGLFEEIQLTNHNTVPVSFELSLTVDSDFLDLFEVRGFPRTKRGNILRYLPTLEETTSLEKEIVLAYQGLDKTLMETKVQFCGFQPYKIEGTTAIWQIKLDVHESLTLGYRVYLFTNNLPSSRLRVPETFSEATIEELVEEKNWRDRITQISTDNEALNQIIDRAVQDVYLLRQTFEGHQVLSAGVPWFSTLFGRDSIISASQTLVLDSAIARDTLYILAHYQGQVEDNWRDEQPGKILHEIRFGEMARCQEVPHTPYYGTVDATPLWLMLYAEYFAWTADTDLLEKLWSNAIAAMDWIDRNCKETGYLAYDRRSKKGLVNQGWKDSEDCIVNRKGEVAQGAIALAEVQGYVYAAKIRMAELAACRNLPDLANQWRSQAKDLKVRFNRDFWVPDLNFCALALDGNLKPVDSIASNPGHCLYLGILEQKKALLVASRLMAPDMFNGWGIRTLSSLSPAYNPMGYHIGTVWHHDNSLIALGLRSLNLIDHSLNLAQGLIDMTMMQPYHRPPELFCGYEQNGFNAPIQYPVACSPQAWATGTIFQLITMIVNFVPNAPSNQLRIIDPVLPKSINHLSIHNLRVGQTILDLEFARAGGRVGDTITCKVSKKQSDLRVVIEV